MDSLIEEINFLAGLSAQANRRLMESDGLEGRLFWMSVSNFTNEKLFVKKKILERVSSLKESI